MRDAQLIRQLGAEITRVLAPFAPPGSTYALLDFPSYANVGDSAIWLGAWKCLTALTGRPPVHCCDWKRYDPNLLRRQLGDGTIFLSGGGNFGDLWESLQRFRERVVEDFPDNPIVLLPQSIHFEQRENLDRARAVFDRHRALTLLARDRPSLEIARREFAAPSTLCPDLAFTLGPLPRPIEPECGTVWLRRKDKEARFVSANPTLEPVDWADEQHPTRAALHKLPRKLIHRAPGLLSPLLPLADRTWNRLAQARLDDGLCILSRGRRVVTDRLHGHVLSLLLGIPHYLYDNTYGKNRALYDTWTHGAESVAWCESAEEALERAREDPEG